MTPALLFGVTLALTQPAPRNLNLSHRELAELAEIFHGRPTFRTRAQFHTDDGRLANRLGEHALNLHQAGELALDGVDLGTVAGVAIPMVMASVRGGHWTASNPTPSGAIVRIVARASPELADELEMHGNGQARSATNNAVEAPAPGRSVERLAAEGEALATALAREALAGLDGLTGLTRAEEELLRSAATPELVHADPARPRPHLITPAEVLAVGHRISPALADRLRVEHGARLQQLSAELGAIDARLAELSSRAARDADPETAEALRQLPITRVELWPLMRAHSTRTFQSVRNFAMHLYRAAQEVNPDAYPVLHAAYQRALDRRIDVRTDPDPNLPPRGVFK